MDEPKFKYAEVSAQIRKINKFLCISTVILYVLTYTVVFISFLQGNRTVLYAGAMLFVMILTTVVGFVTYCDSNVLLDFSMICCNICYIFSLFYYTQCK